MAAARLHFRTINKHQGAKEVAVPKLVGLIEARSEQSAVMSAKKIRGSRYQEGCLMKGAVKRDRLMRTEMTPT